MCQGFPGGVTGKKNLPANIGDIRNIGSIPENMPWRRKFGIQYSCLENPMDRGTWQATVQRFEKTPQSSTLAWKIHGQRSLVGCSPWGHQESDMTERLHFHFSLSCIGEGNGNPLQCSCLENPRDSRAWWAAVYGVAQSWTRLKTAAAAADMIEVTYYTCTVLLCAKSWPILSLKQETT